MFSLATKCQGPPFPSTLVTPKRQGDIILTNEHVKTFNNFNLQQCELVSFLKRQNVEGAN